MPPAVLDTNITLIKLPILVTSSEVSEAQSAATALIDSSVRLGHCATASDVSESHE
jgi:hypothetical protein